MQSKFPVLRFFILSYIISWLVWLPLYGPQIGIEGLPIFPLHHALGGFGPMVASLCLTYCEGGRKDLKLLLRQMMQFKPIVYFMLASLAPFLILLISCLIFMVVSNREIDWSLFLTNKEHKNMGVFGIVFYNLVFFGFGEEMGWRGYALPRLQNQMGLLKATFCLSLFWAIWHWPLFLYRPGYLNMDVGGVVGWVVSLVTGCILLSWLYVKSKGSVLICAVFHATIDIAFNSRITNAEMTPYLGALITVWGSITFFLLAIGKVK